ncbi:MAG: DUF4266 domain-containing protein [Deltaproteobacteria bacterium]|nr:DUF4266 domain-containing protein [Deltaproteobacteria bacterium]
MGGAGAGPSADGDVNERRRCGWLRIVSRLGAVVLIVGAAAAVLSGCKTVEPWERGSMAHFSMDPAAENVAMNEAFRQHVFEAREGAAGGYGRAGGGCGCN